MINLEKGELSDFYIEFKQTSQLAQEIVPCKKKWVLSC